MKTLIPFDSETSNLGNMAYNKLMRLRNDSDFYGIAFEIQRQVANYSI